MAAGPHSAVQRPRQVEEGDRILVEVPASLVHAICRLVEVHEKRISGTLQFFFQDGKVLRRKIEGTADVDRPL